MKHERDSLPIETYHPYLTIIEPLEPDGSSRKLYRGSWKGRGCILFLPAPGHEGIAEARSFYYIGRHLHGAGIRVPEIFHFDGENGVIVVEECGGSNLQAYVTALKEKGRMEEIKGIYEDILDHLLEMAIRGGEGFDTAWCYETPYYNSCLALDKEGRYFLHWFAMRLVKAPAELISAMDKEIEDLAKEIDMFHNSRFFLHRDFQSRNVLLTPDRSFYFIDFQGGRLGPLGYDASSLIHDPYVDLPWDLRELMVEYYIEAASALKIESPGVLKRQLKVLALFRGLQVVGAFAKLGFFFHKPHFRTYLSPALSSLRYLLEHGNFKTLETLRGFVDTTSQQGCHVPLDDAN